jgi:hypothetical protein
MQEMKCLSAALTIASLICALFAAGFSFLAYMRPSQASRSNYMIAFLVCILRQEAHLNGDHDAEANHFNRHATGLTAFAVFLGAMGSLLALWS